MDKINQRNVHQRIKTAGHTDDMLVFIRMCNDDHSAGFMLHYLIINAGDEWTVITAEKWSKEYRFTLRELERCTKLLKNKAGLEVRKIGGKNSYRLNPEIFWTALDRFFTEEHNSN